MNDAGADDHGTLSTGDPAVDEALTRLTELDERDLSRHAEVYDDIHSSLRAALDGAASGNSADQVDVDR